MTEWIDFFVYAALMVTVWVGVPTMNARFTVPLVADRNPDWLAAHPEAARVLENNRGFLWSCYVFGALSLAALLSVTLGTWPSTAAAEERWMVLWDVSTASAIVGIVYFLACGALFARWLHRDVPLAARRQATLERRAIDAFIPRGFRIAIYAVVVLHLAVWLIAGVSGRYSTPAFWGAFAFQFVVSGILFVMARAAVNRRPNAMDRIFGPGYRRTEARWGFAAQLVPLMNGVARLYEHVTGSIPVDVNRVLQLVVVSLVVMGFVRFTLGSRGSRIPRSTLPSATAWTVVLIVCATAFLTPVSPPANSPAAAVLSEASTDPRPSSNRSSGDQEKPNPARIDSTID